MNEWMNASLSIWKCEEYPLSVRPIADQVYLQVCFSPCTETVMTKITHLIFIVIESDIIR